MLVRAEAVLGPHTPLTLSLLHPASTSTSAAVTPGMADSAPRVCMHIVEGAGRSGHVGCGAPQQRHWRRGWQ